LFLISLLFKDPLLLLADVKKPFASLLQFKLKTNFLEQKLDDLKLEKLPSSFLSSIPRDGKQAFAVLFTKTNAATFPSLACSLSF
jgi:hypothetical protein